MFIYLNGCLTYYDPLFTEGTEKNFNSSLDYYYLVARYLVGYTALPMYVPCSHVYMHP